MTLPMTNPPPKARSRRRTAPLTAIAPDRAKDAFPAEIVLVNLTGKPEYVMAGNRPVRLPEGPCPVLIPRWATREDISLVLPPELALQDKKNTSSKRHRRGTSTRASVRVESQPGKLVILCDPPRIDGVVYLVAPDTLHEFPHRDDFVTPASYQMFIPPALRHASPKKQAKKLARQLDKRRMWPLASVARGPLPHATADTPVLQFD